MTQPVLIAIPTSYGVIITAAGRVEHWACNAEIGGQAAKELSLNFEILAPDRLRIHIPFLTWNWKVYHHHYVELLVENEIV